MKRSLSLFPSFLLSVLLGVATACNGNTTTTNSDGGSSSGDGGDSDGGSSDPNLCKGAGCVGATCLADTECTEGNSALPAVCWKGTLLNNPKLVATPGGYCSRECTSNADCGTAKCVTLPGSTKQYCMARCTSASTCRKPDYVCAFDGDTGGICFPNANFDCDPTKGTGQCEVGEAKNAGGCVRAAYENDHGGICHLQCLVGTKTCPPDTRFGTTNAPAQVCVYIDTTVDSKGNAVATGDKFRGNLCFQQSQAPKGPGESCTYWTDCQDGYQCDRYVQTQANQVCRKLCAQGNGTQTPLPGTVMPAGNMPANNTCSGAGESCTNALRAGVINGAAGLCKSPTM